VQRRLGGAAAEDEPENETADGAKVRRAAGVGVAVRLDSPPNLKNPLFPVFAVASCSVLGPPGVGNLSGSASSRGSSHSAWSRALAAILRARMSNQSASRNSPRKVKELTAVQEPCERMAPRLSVA
jgi:hypothetical protein